jgi:hypothetical protein
VHWTQDTLQDEREELCQPLTGTTYSRFDKLSDDETLVKELHAFTKKRNRLSHQGITRCLDRDGELDDDSMATFQRELATIAPEAQRLRRAIFEKIAVLGFDDLTDAG